MNQVKRKIISTYFPELLPLLNQKDINNLDIRIDDILKLKKGEDAVVDYPLIISTVMSQIPPPLKGDKGDTIIVEKVIEKTEVIKEQPIITEITKQIENKDTPLDLVTKLNTLEGVLNLKVIKDYPTIESILQGVIKELKTGKNRLEARDIINLPQKINTKDQRWHGGGISNIAGFIIAGTNITITGSGTLSDPYIISSTAVSSTGYQVPIGIVNGVNQTYDWTIAPNAIVVDGITINKVSSDGSINWTGTTTTVLTIAPNFNIFGVA